LAFLRLMLVNLTLAGLQLQINNHDGIVNGWKDNTRELAKLEK